MYHSFIYFINIDCCFLLNNPSLSLKKRIWSDILVLELLLLQNDHKRNCRSHGPLEIIQVYSPLERKYDVTAVIDMEWVAVGSNHSESLGLSLNNSLKKFGLRFSFFLNIRLKCRTRLFQGLSTFLEIVKIKFMRTTQLPIMATLWQSHYIYLL